MIPRPTPRAASVSAVLTRAEYAGLVAASDDNATLPPYRDVISPGTPSGRASVTKGRTC
jgi:hypothetical protein